MDSCKGNIWLPKRLLFTKKYKGYLSINEYLDKKISDFRDVICKYISQFSTQTCISRYAQEFPVAYAFIWPKFLGVNRLHPMTFYLKNTSISI